MSSSTTSTRELFPSAHSIGESTVSHEIARALWERGVELLSHRELDEMELGPRTDYLKALHAAQFDLGIADGPFQAYRRWQKLCKATTDEITGEQCLRPQWGDGPACLTHASMDQIDPKGAERRKKAEHRARLEASADAALAYVEDVLADTEGVKYPPSLRAKIAMDVLDRSASTSKKHETKTEVTGEIVHTHEAGDRVRAKIERYAAETVDREIEAIEAEFVEGDESD